MHEDAPTVDAPIRAVTVFRTGAVVTRAATLTTPAARLRIAGLPLCLDDASLAARVIGPGAPQVVELRVGLAVTDQERPEPPDERAVLAAIDAERAAADVVEALSRRVAALQAVTSPGRPPGKRGEPPPPSPAAARLAMLDHREALLAPLLEARVEAEQALRRATEVRQAAEEARRRATSARAPRAEELRKQVELALLGCEGPGPWEVLVEYQVPGARWTPGYVVHLEPALDRVRLQLRAAIAQRTGEDWRGVDLTVSTALPLSWTELPTLPALRIGRRQPQPPRTGWRAPPEGAEALYADYLAALARLPAPAAPPPQPPEPAPLAAGSAMISERLDAQAFSVGAAPPSPPPPSPPPPSAPPPPRSAAPLPPGALASPAPMVERARRKSAAPAARMALDDGGPPMVESAAGAAPAPAELAAPAELTAPAELLDYGRLRLAGPDTDQRGQLRPASTLEVYQESIPLPLPRQALAVVEAAVREARMPRLALPPGHLAPGPIRDFDHAWRADHPIDVDSDGAWHTVALREATGPAVGGFVVVPREASEVFRAASFTNPVDGPLPVGPVDVFVGGALLLATRLAPTDRGAEVRLGLGVEEGIKVARNTRYAERSAGLLGGSLALEHVIEIELANNLPVPARIEVRERVPVTRPDDDQVKVRDVRAQPAWEPWEQPGQPCRGAWRWRVEVPAGSRLGVQASYVVDISAKRELVGGNRRES